MAILDRCTLCGGQGFVHFYHNLGEAINQYKDTRRCPNCQGSGAMEPWRQVAADGSSPETWVTGIA